MKKTDIAMIILIASISVIAAYFTVSSIPLFQDVNKPVNVKVATPIVETVEKPDTDLFNDEAINPTVEVIIGDDAAEAAAQGSQTPASEAP